MENLIAIATISMLIIVSPFINKTTKIPISVVEIMLGSIALYIGLLEHSNMLHVLAKVGFLYLMFLAGMEIDLKEFFKIDAKFRLMLLKYFLTTYTLSLIICIYFDLNIVYFLAFPIASIGMIMILIREYGKNIRWLKMVLTIGVVGELISIVGLVVLDGVLKHGVGVELFSAIGTLVLFLVLVALFFRLLKIILWWFPNVKEKVIPKLDTQNRDIRFSVALFFMMISVMIFLELEMVLGAFIAGMFVSTFFEHNSGLDEKLSAFGFGFLIPLFFVYIGTTLDLELLFTAQILQLAIFIMIGMVSIRIFASFFAYRKFLKSPKETFLYSLGDSMPLTFLVAIATIGKSGGALEDYEYYAFITAAMLEAIVIMITIKIIYEFDSIKAKFGNSNKS